MSDELKLFKVYDKYSGNTLMCLKEENLSEAEEYTKEL